MTIHALFDLLAWLTSATTLYVLRRTWFPKNPVGEPLRFGYLAAVLFGAGLGAWIFGTANLWISGIHEFGRSIAGALAGAIFAVEIYKKISSIAARTGAVYALPAALGIAVGRVGCQLSGLDDHTYGIPTGADWGWDFGDGIMRHPVAGYETILMGGFALAYATQMLRGSASWRQNGFYFMIGFYALERFVLEFWKPYASALVGLSLFQLLSIALLIYATAMILSQVRRADSS